MITDLHEEGLSFTSDASDIRTDDLVRVDFSADVADRRVQIHGSPESSGRHRCPATRGTSVAPSSGIAIQIAATSSTCVTSGSRATIAPTSSSRPSSSRIHLADGLASIA